jgi:hypothetical protein
VCLEITTADVVHKHEFSSGLGEQDLVNLKRMLLELVWSSAIEDGKHNASMVHMLSVKGQQPMVPS